MTPPRRCTMSGHINMMILGLGDSKQICLGTKIHHGFKAENL